MPTNLVSGVNTMNCDAITKSAAASQEAPEARALRFQVTNVSLAQNGQGTVRGLSLATLAAALAACGGGGSGGPAAPPPPPPPPPPNNAPTGTDATATAVEDGDPATGSAVGSDEDGDSLTYNVTSDPSHGTLTLADDGSWTYTITDSDEIQALGVGATITDTAEIGISDGEDTASATITITIQGANDDPTGMDGSGMVTAAGSGMVGTAAMGNVGGADVDSGDTLSYAVGTQASHGTLTVDPATGAWTYMVNEDDAAVQALGAGETAMDTGTIVISDDQGGSTTVEVEITITGIVDMPTVDVTTDTVAENDAMGPNLAEVTSPDSGVTFSVDNPAFEIIMVGSTHVLKLKDGHSLDHETSGGSVTLMVTASDSNDVTSHAAEVVINVTDVNEAPMITAADGAVDENAAGATVGAVMVSDYDAADAGLGDANISVSDDRFEVVGGMLKLKDGVSLDHESEDSVTVTVTVTDTGTNGDAISASAEVTVTVNDLNENPEISVMDGETPDGMMARSVISENATGLVGEITVSDVDDGDVLTVSVPMDSGFAVTTDAEGGYWLELTDAVDFETHQSVTVTVTVEDDNGGSATQDVMVRITDADEDPTIMVTGLMPVDEDTPNQVVGTIVVGDVDAKDSLGAGNIMVDDDRFVVRANADGTISLVLAQAIDAEMETSVDVTLTVTDTGGNDTSTMVTVMVAGENETPMISIGNGVTPDGMAANGMADENMADVPIAKITASDPEQGALNHDSLTIVDGDGMEVTDGPFMIAADPEDGVSWLKLATAQDYEMVDGGTHTVIVRVTDAGGLYMDQSYTVTINNVNEAPTASDGSGAVTAGMEMPATTSGELMPMDYDAGTTFTYSGQDAAMYGTLMVNDDGSWTYTVNDANMDVLALREGATLTDTIEVTVTDSGIPDSDGTMHTMATITVTITGVNDDPMVAVADGTPPGGTAPTTGTISEMTADNAGTGAVRQINISDYEDDITAQDIIDSGMENDDGSFSVNGFMVSASDDRFIVQADAEGGLWLVLNEGQNYDGMDGVKSIDVTISVEDSEGGMAEAMTTITIMNVNEPPTIDVDDPKIDEGMTGRVGVVTIWDPEEEVDITLDVEDVDVVDSASPFRVIEPNEGVYVLELTRPIDFESEDVTKDGNDSMTGIVTVTLSVTDMEGLQTTNTIEVVVTNIDEKPTITVMNGMTPDGMMAVSSIDENSNADGDVLVGEIMASDPEDGTYGADDIILSGDHASRFYVKPDDEGGLWLVLKEGEMADFERDMGSIDITLSVEDSAMQSVSQDFSLTLMDVNEEPMGDNDMVMKLVDHDSKADTPDQKQMLEMYEPAYAEDMYEIKLDITNAFDDEDGDTLFTYSIEGPSWLQLSSPVRGDDNTIVVTISGNVPAGELGVHEVMLYAEDQGGMKGMVSFNVIVDDGNDEITDITLTNRDGTENVLFDVTVDENDESGMVFGYLNSVDLDDPRHPHGAHKEDEEKWSVSDKNFEIVEMDGKLALKLKAGMSLDYEAPPEAVMITVTDGDRPPYSQKLALQINNKNDAPTVANQPGNWWVTVDEDLDADDVGKGEWLTFQIEGAGDPTPLFEDKDAGEELTYTLSGSGAAFLDIDKDGVIQNKKGMIADRGVYDVTVTAKDGGEDGAQSVSATFKLAVVLSDEDDEDKATPEIENANGMDFMEGSGAGEVVARFTVENPDLDMKGVHPWGAMTVKLTAAHNTSGDSDVSLDLAYFKAEMESSAEGSEVWVVKVTDAGAKALNHEAFDDVRLTVKVWDNIGTNNADNPDDERTINFDVTDRDEPIMYMPDPGAHSTSGLTGTGNMLSFTTMQQTDPTSDTVTLYLNLSKLFEDEDSDDDDDEMSFSISENTSWLTVKQRPMEWRDIEDANDDDDDPNNDVIWGGTDQTSLEVPDARDIVAIIEIDRDGMMGGDSAPGEISQDNDGSFTIRVTGQQSADRGSATVTVKIMDQNLDAATGGVTISNAKPVQGNRLTMTFDESKDPDFTGPKAGTPIAELYMWKTATDAEGNDETTKSVSINNPMPYVLTDAEEGMHIGATVVYFELFDGNIVRSDDQDATHTDAVVNRNDAPKSTLAVTETDGGELVFAGDVTDADGIPENGDGAKAYKWQYSANGVSGWKDFTDDNADSPMTTTIPTAVVGNYVRLVVTFTDEGGKDERVEAQTSFKVGALIPSPTMSVTIERGEVDVGGSTYVKAGGQLKLNGVTSGARIEWLDGKNVIGTKDTLDITQAHAGKTITVKVTGMKDGNVTYITSVSAATVSGATGGTGNSVPSKAMDMIVDVGATKAEGTLFAPNTVMIDFSTLFDDVEGGLTYNITEGPTAFDHDVLTDEINVNEYMDDNDGGDQLLLVDESDSENVKFYYYSTKGMTHDDSDLDGEGNIVAVTVTATDADANAEVTAMAGIRIDVPATGVENAVSDDKPFGLEVTVDEGTTSTDFEALVINILDENDSTGADAHAYGSYDWANAVVSDPLFEVVAVEGDKSAATFSLKKGVTLDDVHKDTMIPVTVKVKPLGAITDEITITVTVTVTNSNGSTEGGDENTNPENTVPGLKDNEVNDNDDSKDGTDDADGEGDTDEDDGGMAAMMSTMVDDGLF